jgi:hypothetical protein
MHRPALLLLTLAFPLLAISARAGVPEPEHTVVASDGPFEIRDYGELFLVSTPMKKRGSDGSFMKLFRFISGANDRSEKIPMTAPVLMTGPESGMMSFVMPADPDTHGVPAPLSPELSVTCKPAGRYAVYRFGGSGKPAASEAAAAKLLEWAARRNLATDGSPLFAYYDPPWTLWFLRRNEVLVRLAPGH